MFCWLLSCCAGFQSVFYLPWSACVVFGWEIKLCSSNSGVFSIMSSSFCFQSTRNVIKLAIFDCISICLMFRLVFWHAQQVIQLKVIIQA